ncbi:MAG: NAD-dependent epimerase/dehydratase family protein [Planctomycetota bacterium]
MKVLITGSEGFVGPHLIRELRAHHHEPVACPMVRCDIRDAVAWEAVLSSDKPDAVVHLAALSSIEQCARDPRMTWQVNTLAVEDMIRVQARILPGSAFLFVSTSKVYEVQEGPLGEQAPLNPADFYALTKLSADLRCAQLAHELNLRILRVRPFNHTGPGQGPGFLLGDLVARARAAAGRGRSEVEVGDPAAVVDLSDVRDVVRAYRLVLDKAPTGSVFNVGSGSTVRVADLVGMISQAARHTFVPRPMGSFRPGQKRDRHPRVADITLIASSVGWRPRRELVQTVADMWSVE